MSARKKQYDLRSNRRTQVQIPVQLQFQPHGTHSPEATTSKKTMDQCQVSFSESDESSINLDELVNTVESDVESDGLDRVCYKFENSRACNNDVEHQLAIGNISRLSLHKLKILS